ncbi:MAG: HEAT repeat domain-containing protein [Reichenbachiella sp.]
MADIESMVKALSGELGEKAYEVSDSLALLGGEAVLKAMLELLEHSQRESRFMAARTLGKMHENAPALQPLFEAINNKENKGFAGDLLATIENYDLSGSYVEIFKLYLNGSFKVSAIAQDYLDYKDFEITQRVIKKASKHWNHYVNNVKQDELFDLKKIEVEERLNDLKAYLEC